MMDGKGYREEERWKPRGCSSADSRCAEAVLGVVYRDEGKRSRDPRGIRVGSSFRCDRFEVASCPLCDRPISLDRCKFHWGAIRRKRDVRRGRSLEVFVLLMKPHKLFILEEEFEDWRFE